MNRVYSEICPINMGFPCTIFSDVFIYNLEILRRLASSLQKTDRPPLDWSSVCLCFVPKSKNKTHCYLQASRNRWFAQHGGALVSRETSQHSCHPVPPLVLKLLSFHLLLYIQIHPNIRPITTAKRFLLTFLQLKAFQRLP